MTSSDSCAQNVLNPVDGVAYVPQIRRMLDGQLPEGVENAHGVIGYFALRFREAVVSISASGAEESLYHLDR